MNSRQKELNLEYLSEEEKVLRMIQDSYEQAAKDCADKIAELSMRTDMENLQSIIYQQKYQEAILTQIQGTLLNLQNGEYKTVDDYLTRCYQNGFIGTMYDLQGQGIPMSVPIDPKQMYQAIQLDSKLSDGMYNRLGENIDDLKTAVKLEVSRGIASGKTWNETASDLRRWMTSPFKTANNNAQRIARTEGHRVQMEAQMDACEEAKSKGADVVKQWDATLDGRTRDSHAQVDGEIRELDEKFSNGLRFPSDPHGAAGEVINCRCALLQRARWALDDDELDNLQQRANYFGLDKSENFDDYRQKYLGVGEKEFASASPMYLNKSDRLYANASKMIPEEGFEDVVCHGNEYGFCFKDADEKESNVSVKEFCEMLEENPNYKGGNIRLITCNAARGEAIVPRYISNYFGITVMAPTEAINVYTDGTYSITNDDECAKMKVNTGEWKIFEPKE